MSGKRNKSSKSDQKMEEMMTVMMETAAQENSTPPATTKPPLTPWKLYPNPCYYYHSQHHKRHLRHSRRRPSARKLAASLRRHHAFSHPMSYSSMQSQLDLALTQIQELKAEVEFERRLRKKAESSKKRLEREVLDERERREATERLCEVLAKEIAAEKAEMDRMKEEMEEERKTWRVAEAWREERVRMKMADARVLMEEKVSELCRGREEAHEKKGEDTLGISEFVMGNCWNSNYSGQSQSLSKGQRNRSPEAENPHIRRGIKGFVEFPRVVRAMGSRGRQLGSKLECQKAQLRLFLKQKNPIGLGRSSSLNLAVGG